MELKFRIEFSELNINVNVIPSGDAAVIQQLEALKAQLDEKEQLLKAALEQSQTTT